MQSLSYAWKKPFFFTASGTGTLHNMDGAIEKEDYVEILPLYLDSAARWIKVDIIGCSNRTTIPNMH